MAWLDMSPTPVCCHGLIKVDKCKLKCYFNKVVIVQVHVMIYADMAELADAPDLGSGVYDVQVQVLLSAAKRKRRS